MEGAREAVANQVLVTDADGDYAFRHALVGEAVHGDLLPGERHRRCTRGSRSALEADPALLGDVAGADASPPSSPATGTPRTSSPRALGA